MKLCNSSDSLLPLSILPQPLWHARPLVQCWLQLNLNGILDDCENGEERRREQREGGQGDERRSFSEGGGRREGGER